MDVKNKRQTLITFYFIFILFGLSMVVVDPLIPIIAEEIDVGFDTIGNILFAGSIVALIANIIAGRLSDRFDIKRLVLLGLLFLFLAYGIFGAYLNLITFIIVTILLRLGFSTIDTSVHAFSSKLFKKDISRVFLKLDIAWYAGAVAGPLAVSGILYFNIGPRYLFLVLAFLYIVFIIIFNRMCPRRKIEAGISTGNIAVPRKNMFKIIKDPGIIIGSLILLIMLGAIIGLTTWMTTYFLSLDIDVSFSSWVLSLYWFFSIIGMLITTRLVNRFREVVILFYSCLAGIMFLAIFTFTPVVYIKIAALALQAVCFASIFPLTTAISANRDPDHSGTILGFTIAFAFAGSIIFQPIYGYVTEYLGKEYISYIALGGTVIGFVFVSLLFRILWREGWKSR